MACLSRKPNGIMSERSSEDPERRQRSSVSVLGYPLRSEINVTVTRPGTCDWEGDKDVGG